MKRRSIIRQLFLFTGGICLSPSGDPQVAENSVPTETNSKDQDLIRRGTICISGHHPRLFVRADESKIGRGLTVTELRRRKEDPDYKEWITETREINDYSDLPQVAMQYLLYGRESDALSVYNYLVDYPPEDREHTSTAAGVYFSAIAFDWIRRALTDQQAQEIIRNLIKGAEILKPGVASPSINHNYTIVSFYGLTAVALAIYGEGENNTQIAQEYIDLSVGLLEGEGKLLDTFKAKKGSWTEGNHYSPYVVFQTFFMAIRSLTTATDRDYFKLIRDRYDNFIASTAKFIIANFRPDLTLERIGDVTRRVVPTRSTMYPILELLATEINDPILQGQVRSFSNELLRSYGAGLVPELFHWMVLVNYDSSLPDGPSYKTLPLVMRFGAGTYEQICFRNNWDEDGTSITCVSGCHFTDHQHFDKGSFLIYKKGALTVDGGGYSDMYSSSWANYSTRSLAHNCVIVHDPGETPYSGIETEIIPDGGQRVIRYAQSQTSWQEYLKESRTKGLHTARVLAFGFNKQYHYVKSDLTNAYQESVTCMDRQLLYFPEADYLIVKDIVITNKPLDKYWLLHFEDCPTVDGHIPEAGITVYDDANEIVVSRTDILKRPGKQVRYTGKLFIRTVLPQKRSISIIGGPGYEYYSRFSKRNFPPEEAFSPWRESGKWRVEINPEKADETTTFLHALEIADSGKKDMVGVKHIRSTEGHMEGVQFLGDSVQYVGLFRIGKDTKVDHPDNTDWPVHLTLQAPAPTIYVLTELKPGQKVVVAINNREKGAIEVTDAGVLYFKDNDTGTRNIQITSI